MYYKQTHRTFKDRRYDGGLKSQKTTLPKLLVKETEKNPTKEISVKKSFILLVHFSHIELLKKIFNTNINIGSKALSCASIGIRGQITEKDGFC